MKFSLLKMLITGFYLLKKDSFSYKLTLSNKFGIK